MKLYFPTSSLNFNDIFATESISPKYFYQNRTFGTRRHFLTELVLNEYCITLFEKLPYFELLDSSKSEYEEYPIVLEFDINPEQFAFKKIDDGIYVTFKTLYLNLYNVKVIFFSKTDYKTILTKSKLVNETKTVSKYKIKFEVIENPSFVSSPDLSKYSFAIKDEEKAYTELKLDRTFNNIKGFFYAYITSKITLDYRERLSQFDKSLEALAKLRELSDLYTKLTTNNSELILDLTTLSLKYAKQDAEKSKIICDEFLNTLNIFVLNDKNHIEFDKTKVRITDEMFVFQIILNTILDMPKAKVGDISKEELDSIVNTVETKILKTVNTKSIYAADYSLIHQRVFNRNYNIDISNISSYVLQNFLAFILKCNNIDEFFNFLELKNIKNSNLAFAFLGAFVGFSGLSRIITNDLFSIDNDDLLVYIDKILINFRKQIRINIDNIKTKNITSYKNVNSLENRYLPKTNDRSSIQPLLNSYIKENIKGSLDITNENELKKDIYSEIQRIKASKTLNSFLKKSDVTLTSDIQVKFEKTGNDVEITFLDLKNDKIINIILKGKNNLKENEVKLFKDELNKLKLPKSSFNGNYPIFRYNKTIGDENQKLSVDEEKWLLGYLKLLK